MMPRGCLAASSRHYNLRMAAQASLLFLACLITPIVAQEPKITPDAQVDSSSLHNWLHSADPRLIAWSADFARRRHDSQLISEIPGVLEHWSTPPIANGHKEQVAQRRAVLALLDTLIQENVQVAIPVIKSVAETFPAQSMLLIQRVPLKNSGETLMTWVFNRDGMISDGRSRAAAMILAKAPDPAFVYRMLEGLELNVALHIVPPNSGYGTGGSFPGCGRGFPDPPTPGWPQVYDYSLREEYGETGREDSNSTLVVELAGNRVSAERFEEGRGPSRCSFLQSDNAFRHELVAYWLGVKPGDMPWQPDQSFAIAWTTKAAYEKQIDSIIESDRTVVSDTILQLQHRGLLDQQITGGTFPRIKFGVYCDIRPCPLQGTLVFKR
jgi:hypothetical protein